MSTPRAQEVFYHPILGPISVEDDLLKLVRTAEMTRLRRIKQLTLMYLLSEAVSAHHTRFEHSLGVYYLARLLSDRLVREDKIDSEVKSYLEKAALLHDIGHSALSHLGEFIAKALGLDIKHEDLSAALIIGDYEYIVEKFGLSGNYVEYLKSLIGRYGDHTVSQVLDDRTKYAVAYLIATDQTLRKSIESRLSGEILAKLEGIDELLNGPIDLDKIEYLAHDAHLCWWVIQVRPLDILAALDYDPQDKRVYVRKPEIATLIPLLRSAQYTALYLNSENMLIEGLFEVVCDYIIKNIENEEERRKFLLEFWFSDDEKALVLLNERLRDLSDRVKKKLEELRKENPLLYHQELQRQKIVERTHEVIDKLVNKHLIGYKIVHELSLSEVLAEDEIISSSKLSEQLIQVWYSLSIRLANELNEEPHNILVLVRPPPKESIFQQACEILTLVRLEGEYKKRKVGDLDPHGSFYERRVIQSYVQRYVKIVVAVHEDVLDRIRGKLTSERLKGIIREVFKEFKVIGKVPE